MFLNKKYIPIKMTPIKFKIKLVSLFSLTILLFYWVITIFYVLPPNDLNVRSYRFYKYFDIMFFQRWAFFAPPPTFNEHLYFNFFTTKNEFLERFEVLEELAKKKQKAAPFNKKEDVLDYLMANTVSSLIDNSRQLQEVINYEQKEKLQNISDSLKQRMLHDALEKTDEFHSLKNYAAILALQNGLDTSHLNFQVQISRIAIPPFAERFSKKKQNETYVFNSTIQKL